jgi:DNA-binding PadR family transcriptional regulator
MLTQASRIIMRHTHHPHHSHHHGHREAFAGPRGGGRRRRLFDQAELQTLLLSLLAERPRHGYDLIKAIETLSAGEYAPSPGVVYPALTFMEEQGVIAAQDAGASRKAYGATDEGQTQLARQAEAVAALRQRLEAMARQREKTDPAPVRRAMHSMKTALFDRLNQEGVGRETVLAVAEIIDDAARKIERIEA